ncbi:hypothetical protein N9S36_00545 [bacterium]|nr:hypothetical protein [bacterium]
MKQFIYKIIISIIAVVLIYEFTIGKQIKRYSEKFNYVTTKEGRKDFIIYLRHEIKKGIDKERYLSKEDAKLLNQFISKIQKELKQTEN